MFTHQLLISKLVLESFRLVLGGPEDAGVLGLTVGVVGGRGVDDVRDEIST